MIQSINDSNSFASLLSSQRKTNQAAPTATAFGQVFEQNTTQFANKETADMLAQFLGGKVVDISDQWMGGKAGPMLQIDMGQDHQLNAGLLADRFMKYDLQSAIAMTEAETGSKINIKDPKTLVPVSVSEVTKSSVPAPAPVSITAAATADIAMNLTGKSNDASPEKLEDAGRQFEGLLVGQILKAATTHEDEGVLSGGGDAASSSVMEMAQENFAKALSAGAGMGIAKSIVDSMAIRQAATKGSIHS